MIEEEAWAGFTAEYKDNVKRAFATIAISGVLERQVRIEMLRLMEGDASQNPKELAKEILRVRADTQGLMTVHNYGLQLTQELESGEE